MALTPEQKRERRASASAAQRRAEADRSRERRKQESESDKQCDRERRKRCRAEIMAGVYGEYGDMMLDQAARRLEPHLFWCWLMLAADGS